MSRRKDVWHVTEKNYIINNYANMTIKELSEGLEELTGKSRTDDAINSMIRRLKRSGRIEGGKDKETIDRSLKQRRK